MKAERAAAELAALVGWQTGPRGAATGWAAPGRAGRERGREKKAGLAGPEGDFLPFFQIKCLSNSIFSIFILSQIQISFEYKFQIF